MTALGNVMREVNAAIGEMLGEHDPLASHILVSPPLQELVRHQELPGSAADEGGKRHHLSARLTWQQACDLGSREPRRVGAASGAARKRD